MKTKTRLKLTVDVNNDEAKKLEKHDRQTGCTGPNVNDAYAMSSGMTKRD